MASIRAENWSPSIYNVANCRTIFLHLALEPTGNPSSKNDPAREPTDNPSSKTESLTSLEVIEPVSLNKSGNNRTCDPSPRLHPEKYTKVKHDSSGKLIKSRTLAHEFSTCQFIVGRRITKMGHCDRPG